MSIHQVLADSVNEEPTEVTRPQDDPRTRTYGPYLLMPRHRVLGEASLPTVVAGLRYGRVALYGGNGNPSLLATDGRRLVMVPISTFDVNGSPTQPEAIGDELGAATFLLPAHLFLDLPFELAAGQSHVELSISYNHQEQSWVADVQQRPMPQLAEQHRYRLEDGFEPQPADARWPTPTAISKVLRRGREEATKVITFDTTFLRQLTAAIGTRDVSLHLHGRTGIIRVEPAGETEDDYGVHAIGLMMPMAFADDELADELERRQPKRLCDGGAC